jgi:hypothetical protein
VRNFCGFAVQVIGKAAEYTALQKTPILPGNNQAYGKYAAR